jgi:hypothetical protein
VVPHNLAVGMGRLQKGMLTASPARLQAIIGGARKGFRAGVGNRRLQDFVTRALCCSSRLVAGDRAEISGPDSGPALSTSLGEHPYCAIVNTKKDVMGVAPSTSRTIGEGGYTWFEGSAVFSTFRWVGRSEASNAG